MRCHFTLTELKWIKNLGNIKGWQECAEMGVICGEMVNFYTVPESSLFLAGDINTWTPYHPAALPPTHIPERNSGSSICMRTFTAALTWTVHVYLQTQTGCNPNAHEKKTEKKLWDMQKEGKSPMSVSGWMTAAGKSWTNLRNVILGEKSKWQQKTHLMTSFLNEAQWMQR